MRGRCTIFFRAPTIMNYIYFILAFSLVSCSTNDKKVNELSKTSNTSLLKLDSNNYYNYCSDGTGKKGEITTAWLEDYEIVPVLLDEMNKEGFDKNNDNQLYNLSPKEYVVLTAYNDDPKIGFIYIPDHEAFPLKSHRNRKSIYQTYDSCEYQIQMRRVQDDSLIYIPIQKLPKNLFLLQSDCYWYQYSNVNSDNDSLVSKQDALNIFREDVRAILAKVPRQ
jgi:hypothetical protein